MIGIGDKKSGRGCFQGEAGFPFHTFAVRLGRRIHLCDGI